MNIPPVEADGFGSRLSGKEPGDLTRVPIRSVLTDPCIEESVREAIVNQKRLGAKQVTVEIERTLQKFAETGTNTILVPARIHGFDMILPTDNLKKPLGSR